MRLPRLNGVIDGALERGRLRRAPGRPTQIHMSVTDRCFLPCLHCDIWKNEAVDLPGELWLNALDRLAQWVGPAAINFVGGEPFLRKDLEDLMGRAVELGNTVSFNTNAWLLTEKRVRRVADAGVSIAYISMDGFSKEVVDHSRGREGSWQKCMEAFELFDRVGGPRVVIASILHEENAREIVDLYRFTKERGYQLVVHPLYQNFGEVAYDRHWYRESPLWPKNPEAICEALDFLVEERRRGGPVCNSSGQLVAMKDYYRAPGAPNGLTCKAGHSDIAFDPQGNVRLCYFLEPVANLHDLTPLAAIWDGPRALRRRWEVHTCERACSLLNCNFESSEP